MKEHNQKKKPLFIVDILHSLCRWTRQNQWTRSITELASSPVGTSCRGSGFSKTIIEAGADQYHAQFRSPRLDLLYL